MLQGERELAIGNRTLGRFQLIGLPPAPRGVPQVEVSFDIDANGILNVSAKDIATGKEQAIQIQSSSGLSKEEVEKMRKEAEEHAGEDKKKREPIEARNQADSLAYSVEKTLKENADKVSDDDKKKIEEAIAELNKVKEGDDPAEIKRCSEALANASHSLAQMLYQQAQAAQQAEGGADAASDAEPTADAGAHSDGVKDDGDIVDADFEVMDDDKTNE